MTRGPEQEPESEPRLDSWKEIATFLGRGIRTVQRWEREEGLPVHRLEHAKRGSVYAIRNELAAWWESRRQRDAAPPSTDHAERSETISPPSLEHVTRTSAATTWPSLSSDARMIVYVSDAGKDGESPQVWLQQIGGAAVQLTSGQLDCAEPTFSADDTRVIFTATAESTGNVYDMPALGGQPRVLKRAARNARFSPDGNWLAYITLEPAGSIRLLPAAGGKERPLAESLVDIASATWSADSRHLMVLGHPDASVELDYWVVPIDGGTPVDTRALQRARQQGFVVISTSHAWAGDSIFFSAAWRQGVHVWRQRIAPETFESIGAPEPMTPGADMAFFPTAARNRLAFVGTHADTNIWSIALDAASGTPYGPLRRLTRGPGIVGHLTLSHDGRALAYFAVRTIRGELRVRNLESGSETMVEADPAFNPGFPTISPGGQHIAYGALVPGPPLQRPVLIVSLVDGESRLVRDDCGGRPRQWLDEQTLLVETFGSGLNSFFLLDTRDGSQRPLLSSAKRKVSNPRISPDGRWLAFDAKQLGGSPQVSVAPLAHRMPVTEPEWTVIGEPSSHPFWSRDGRLLYYLATFPNADIRSRILARGFDTSTGRVEDKPADVLTLREMIVPAMVTGTAPIVAPDQMIFILGDFRGDVWIRDT